MLIFFPLPDLKVTEERDLLLLISHMRGLKDVNNTLYSKVPYPKC